MSNFPQYEAALQRNREQELRNEIERLRKENETLRTMARELAEEVISLGDKHARKT